MHLYAYIYIYTDEAETQQINDMPSSEMSTRDDHSCPYWLGSTQEDIDSDGEDDKADLFQSLSICDNGQASFINDRNSELEDTRDQVVQSISEERIETTIVGQSFDEFILGDQEPHFMSFDDVEDEIIIAIGEQYQCEKCFESIQEGTHPSHRRQNSTMVITTK